MFGFLKNKLKEWVDTAKDKLKPSEEKKEETKIEETKEEPTIKKPKKAKKEKKIKKEKKEKAKEIIEIPKVKPEEAGTAIEIETELEEGVPQEIIDQELATSREDTSQKPLGVWDEEEKIKKAEEEIKETQEIAEEIQEGKISPEKAVEEIEEIEKEPVVEKKEGFISRLFGKKKKEPEIEEPKAIEKEKAIKEEEEVQKLVEKRTFFQKVRETFIYKITEEDFNTLFEGLEMLLLENNVALEVVEDIKSGLSKKLIGREIEKDNLETEIKKELKKTLNEILIDPDDPIEAIKMKREKPFVILFFGINGTGKTTSIAKLTHLLKSKNYSVALAAADTFRAASIEQISEHASKLGVPLIKHDYQADPAAVGFDAIKYAKAHQIDVVLIDTAGRMHTKTNLLSEMEKICRVTNPDLKIFVAESIAGNDATEQARTFNEAIGIDGAILSKADVDEKGGTIISVSHATKKPIFYLGTGQNYRDLKLFNKEEYIDSLGL